MQPLQPGIVLIYSFNWKLKGYHSGAAHPVVKKLGKEGWRCHYKPYKPGNDGEWLGEITDGSTCKRNAISGSAGYLQAEQVLTYSSLPGCTFGTGKVEPPQQQVEQALRLQEQRRFVAADGVVVGYTDDGGKQEAVY
jgi:hypothetical protein